KKILEDVEISLADAVGAYAAVRELASNSASVAGLDSELAIALEAKTACERAATAGTQLVAVIDQLRAGQSAYTATERALRNLAVSAKSSSNIVILARLSAMERSPSSHAAELLRMRTCGFCKRILQTNERRVAGLKGIICQECLKRLRASPLRSVTT